MSIFNILVVEDEPVIADDIEATLLELDYDVADIVDNGKDALIALTEHKIDLILMDISIDGSMDGIQLAKKINQNYNIPIIFLTSFYNQKTLDRAKEINPAGYIVKPFDEADLKANIEIALSRASATKITTQEPEKLFLRNGQEIISVMSSEIIYVEAFDNYAIVFTEKEKFMISHTLKSVEDKLLPLGFKRIHRSYLINFSQVDSLSEGYVYLKGHKVLIGKSYKKEFIESLSML